MNASRPLNRVRRLQGLFLCLVMSLLAACSSNTPTPAAEMDTQVALGVSQTLTAEAISIQLSPQLVTPEPSHEDPEPTETPLPRVIPTQRETGLVNSNIQDGQGELLVKNGTEGDGLVVLTTLDEQPVLAAYIQVGDAYRLTGIPDGEYLLFFSQGLDWDEANRLFMKNATYQRFTDVFLFSSTGYTVWEVTLYPIVDGNAASQSVDPEEFPMPP